MIKINWSEVEATKNQLLRNGATDSFEMMIIIFYHTKHDCDKIQIQLGSLEKTLFEICANLDVKGIFLYDAAMKKPYFKVQEADRVNELEEVPSSGHAFVITEFNKMSPRARHVWVKIAISQQQHYIKEESLLI